MSGLNFNSTDNKPNTIKDIKYRDVSLTKASKNNDFDLVGKTSINIRTGDAAIITGIKPESEGQVIYITNVIGDGITVILQHLGDGSQDAYKIDLTANNSVDLKISYLNTAVLKYNDLISKWLLVSYSAI